MIRLILAALCVLGLAFAPVGAAQAFVSKSNAMTDCVTGAEMPSSHASGMQHMPMKDRSSHHGMNCCTPQCHAAAPLMFTPYVGVGSEIPEDSALISPAPAQQLSSLPGSGLDPPPRG